MEQYVPSGSKSSMTSTYEEMELHWLEAAEADAQLEKTFDHWFKIARGITDSRDHALAEANTQTPHGALYKRSRARWLETNPWAAKYWTEAKESFRRQCYFWMDNAEPIAAWRAKLNDFDRRRWSTPEVVAREYKAAHPQLFPKKPKDPAKETPLAKAQAEAKEAKAALAHAEERLAAVDGDGLIDPSKTKPYMMLRSILSAGWAYARAIHAGLTKALEEAEARGKSRKVNSAPKPKAKRKAKPGAPKVVDNKTVADGWRQIRLDNGETKTVNASLPFPKVGAAWVEDEEAAT
jgi:hypothetical protein